MIKNFSVKKNYAFIDTLNLKGKKIKILEFNYKKLPLFDKSN